MLIAVAVNPRASFGRARHTGKEVAGRFRTAGAEVLLLCADSYAGLAQAVGNALESGVDALVVVGGDGTIHLGFNTGKITAGGTSRWFAGVVSAGFDAAVNERANGWRWPRGKIRYQLVMLRELASFRAGKDVGHPAVQLRRVSTVELAASNIVAYADGERIGALPMTIEVVPHAACVLA